MNTVREIQVARDSREFFLSKRFYDKQRFPYNFSRSGDFTIFEANLLERFGSLFRAIELGLVTNPNKDDKRLLKVVSGVLPPVSLEEKIWTKYNRLKQRTQIWLVDQEKVQTTYFQSENDDSYGADSDSDTDIDNDVDFAEQLSDIA